MHFYIHSSISSVMVIDAMLNMLKSMADQKATLLNKPLSP
jgi:hypothetical protein